MESDNWIVQNLQNSLDTWNGKLSEIWQLLTQSPQTFKGGGIWEVIVNINGTLQAIGYALLVLFFLVGMVKTCGSLAEVKKPEHALKLFVRFAIAKGVITCPVHHRTGDCVKDYGDGGAGGCDPNRAAAGDCGSRGELRIS